MPKRKKRSDETEPQGSEDDLALHDGAEHAVSETAAVIFPATRVDPEVAQEFAALRERIREDMHEIVQKWEDRNRQFRERRLGNAPGAPPPDPR